MNSFQNLYHLILNNISCHVFSVLLRTYTCASFKFHIVWINTVQNRIAKLRIVPQISPTNRANNFFKIVTPSLCPRNPTTRVPFEKAAKIRHGFLISIVPRRQRCENLIQKFVLPMCRFQRKIEHFLNSTPSVYCTFDNGPSPLLPRNNDKCRHSIVKRCFFRRLSAQTCENTRQCSKNIFTKQAIFEWVQFASRRGMQPTKRNYLSRNFDSRIYLHNLEKICGERRKVKVVSSIKIG